MKDKVPHGAGVKGFESLAYNLAELKGCSMNFFNGFISLGVYKELTQNDNQLVSLS
jgi:hypothetical protein